MSDGTQQSPAGRVFCWSVMRNSLIVGAVVGTILNLINQGDALAGEGSVNWLKVGLTYVVPFCVSTWGSYVAIRMFNRKLAALKGSAAER